MNFIAALIICRISKTPVTLNELRQVKKNKNELEPYLRAIIELNKGNITYSREVLLNYHLEHSGNLENISHGLIASKQIGKSLTLKEAIGQDKIGINILEQIKKENENGA